MIRHTSFLPFLICAVCTCYAPFNIIVDSLPCIFGLLRTGAAVGLVDLRVRRVHVVNRAGTIFDPSGYIALYSPLRTATDWLKPPKSYRTMGYPVIPLAQGQITVPLMRYWEGCEHFHLLYSRQQGAAEVMLVVW